jgi:methanogenic corrinoid protein MtbC1
MDDLKALMEAVEQEHRNEAKKRTQALLDAGKKPMEIVDQGLVPAMASVGDLIPDKWSRHNESFPPNEPAPNHPSPIVRFDQA